MTHRRPRGLFLALLVGLLFTIHLGIGPFVALRHADPTTLLGGGVLLALLIHLGVLGPLLGTFRRRGGARRPGSDSEER